LIVVIPGQTQLPSTHVASASIPPAQAPCNLVAHATIPTASTHTLRHFLNGHIGFCYCGIPSHCCVRLTSHQRECRVRLEENELPSLASLQSSAPTWTSGAASHRVYTDFSLGVFRMLFTGASTRRSSHAVYTYLPRPQNSPPYQLRYRIKWRDSPRVYARKRLP
jgi:hypothetical protein